MLSQLAVSLCVAGALLRAQDADRNMIDSRAAQIEAQRQAKAGDLAPDAPSTWDRRLQWVKDHKVLERLTAGVAGVRVRLGGLATTSGFAAGPEYFRRLANDRVIVRSSLRGSWHKFYLADAELRLPRLLDDHAFLNLYTVHSDWPRVDFYGEGPNSAKSGRTAYALENTAFEARAGFTPVAHLRIGGSGRYLMIDVGPGRDDRFASTERVFSPAVAPGIDRQANYLEGGPFVQYDWRDNPGGPRHGGNYVAEFATFSDRKLGAGSFDQVNLEAQQYISFTNGRRVIALRGRGEFTEPRGGNFVPFYLQPTLGGPETLRGFRPFRFYDNNAIVLNGEYRWEVFSGLDMALFYDTGKVFHRWQDVDLAGLKRSYGFGFRFNVRNDVFLRIDTGFSREGFQVWFKFANVY